MLSLFLGLLATTVFANPIPTVVSSAKNTCVTGVHLIVAHGSTETGYGDLDSVVTGVLAAIPGSSSEYIDYPATLTHYPTSEAAGVTNMTVRIESYVTSCPNTKVVFLGYSQGAQVVMDILCGSTAEDVGTGLPPIASEYTTTLSSVVNWGDPSFVLGQSYDEGNSTMNGIYPRQNLTACDPYASRIHSYCDAGDPFCASGNDVNVHVTYQDVYTQASIDWVVSEFS